MRASHVLRRVLTAASRPQGSAAVARCASSAASGAAAADVGTGNAPFGVRAALVRGLPSTFASSLKMQAPGEPIDMQRAQQEHDAYVALLRELVPIVIEVEADDRYPDAVFIEDTAIVTPSGVAIISLPGAPERRGEVEAVAAALQRLKDGGGGAGGGRPLIRAIHRIEPPGLLDGGDVLQVAGHLFVGLSARTNAAAASQLRAALAAAGDASAVLELPVPHGLHLKSAMSALDAATLLVSDDAAGRAAEAGLRAAAPALAARLAFERLPDPLAANVLRVGAAVVAQGTPGALAALRALCGARGLALRALPGGFREFAKADGALTCCSILLA
ncbi:MAG: hypothetical protein J3K34DRAFT_409953 [Monoraphidium minutum]|nr:MAG: hypothetical protein J3K34DRAFT_409953 [Monoraphidium minutum]